MNYLFDGISLQNGRQSNMDSLLLNSRRIAGKNTVLAVVCDGVGSLAEGAFASGTAVVMIGEWYNKLTSTERIGLVMRDAILDINSSIVAEAKKTNADTASTLSAILLVENDFYIIHIGDSRVYSCDDDGLKLHTRDDVTGTGKLTGYIGRNEQILLQYSEGRADGKTFLVCSDGLYKRMDESLMASGMKTWSKRSKKDTIKSLTQHVIINGEQDNITLAILR